MKSKGKTKKTARSRTRKAATSGPELERALTPLILDTLGALTVILDGEGRIVRVNAACERATGYSADELLGKAVWDFLLIPDEVEPVKAVFAELKAGHFPNTFENYWVAKDGTRRR
ncbi:MAG: PAS domain-containing protein, partial [Gemmatimonadetes bacterium]|nr:PAS domain-containing protein [Gemmatimonadota bacterium]